MPKINVYLPDELAAAVREAGIPVSAICQGALEQAVRDVSSARATDEPPPTDGPGRGLFRRFTPRARTILELADRAARDVPHDFIGTEHVLLGVLEEGSGLAVRVLADLDIDLDDLRAELTASLPAPTALVKGHIPFTALAKRALELTSQEALALAHNYIGTEHVLLGLLAVEEGLASKVLRRMGLELRTTRRAVVNALGGSVLEQLRQPRREEPPADGIEQILRRLDAIEERLPG